MATKTIAKISNWELVMIIYYGVIQLVGTVSRQKSLLIDCQNNFFVDKGDRFVFS